MRIERLSFIGQSRIFERPAPVIVHTAGTRGLLRRQVSSTPAAVRLSASEVPSDEAGASGPEASDGGFCSFYTIYGTLWHSVLS